MTTPELNDDFRDLLQCLRDARAEFVIVGAHALAAHGLLESAAPDRDR